MRRLLAVLVTLVALLAGAPLTLSTASPAAAAPRLPDNPGLGLRYQGLREAAPDSICAGAFEAEIDPRFSDWVNEKLCTHGPDPAPAGVDVRQNREPDPAAELASPAGSTAAEGGAVPCYGTGSDGFRVQLVYARNINGIDRFATYAASFQSWATRIDQLVNDSAAETGGSRHVRFVTDSACNPVIDRVALSSAAMSTFSTMESEIRTKGFSRPDRKYLVWTDTNAYCGISEIQNDDRADATPGVNRNNGSPFVKGSIGRVDNGCWGQTDLVEAHELMHLLGGVQTSAPNATSGFHCKDEYDRLCYPDGTPGATMRYVCPSAHEKLYDCNHDDYFSTAPAFGSYLATHWNTANSAFLSASGSVVTTTTTTSPPPTTTTTTLPPTTTTSTTVPPTTTTTATTVPPVTTTTLPPTTTTTPPTGGAVPSAPQSLSARQPAVGPGVQLSWSAPATGPVTGYRVYRGTSPYTQNLLATVGNVLGYTDASALPTIYYYRVAAYNDAGEGPPSALAGMIGKAGTAAGVASQEPDPRFVLTDPRLGASWIRRWA